MLRVGMVSMIAGIGGKSYGSADVHVPKQLTAPLTSLGPKANYNYLNSKDLPPSLQCKSSSLLLSCPYPSCAFMLFISTPKRILSL
jgi:hypothetical protein